MPDDLMSQVRAAIEEGAAPLTLDEIRVGTPARFPASRRRRGPFIASVIGIAAACAVGLVVAVALAGDDAGVHVTSPASGQPDLQGVDVAHLDRSAEVFMLLDATGDQIAAVRAALDASPDVASYVALDHAAAYRELADVDRCDSDLVGMIRAENLPLSFRVVTKDPGGVARLQAVVEGLPGVALAAGSPRLPSTHCSTVPTLPAAGEPPADPAAAHDAVVAAFSQAWDGTSSFPQRRAAMQNFPDTDRLVEEFDQLRPNDGTPMRAVVSDIVFSSPERAEVLYHLEYGGVTTRVDQGVAVLQDGVWKIDRETVCTEAQRVGVACAG
jgi:hypothetical protein